MHCDVFFCAASEFEILLKKSRQGLFSPGLLPKPLPTSLPSTLMAAKRKRTEQDAAQGFKKKMAGPGSDDEFVDDDKEPTEAVAPDGSIIKLPQVRPALPAVS